MKFTMRSMTAAAILIGTITCGQAGAQVQSTDQQKCINALNGNAGKLGALQGKANLACLKGAAAGDLSMGAQDCLDADEDGKLAATRQKTVSLEESRCTTAPDFAYSGSAAVNSAAPWGRTQTIADMFGSNLDAAVVACATDDAGCRCQMSLAKGAEALSKAKWKTFAKCKKASLAAGAASDAEIVDCLDDPALSGSVAADTDGKLGKLEEKLSSATAACDENGASAAAVASGSCSGLTGTALADCIGRYVDCRVCQSINDADGLETDCDSFAGESCGCSPLSVASCDDGIACTVGDVCGAGTCSGTALDPNRAAAINSQVVSSDEFDVVRLTIGLVTLTDQPFQLSATGLSFPAGFDQESLVTDACTVSGSRYRCQHTAVLVATSACTGSGDYHLTLQYSCTPGVSGCSLCDASDGIDFTLNTENFCVAP